jgi:hypothetical protein
LRTSFSKTWEIKPILLGLSIHFVLWWTVSIWLWTRFNWKLWSDMMAILIALVYFGVFDELRAVTGDQGGRGVIAHDPSRVAAVPVDTPMPADIDTPRTTMLRVVEAALDPRPHSAR